MSIASCIGCGCDDLHACAGNDGPCSWIVVDYEVGRGVCSCCEGHLKRWNAGDRSVMMLVARITKEGDTEPYFIEKNDMASFPYLLDAEAGDKFTVEWVEMTEEQFEALPQFEHIRLTKNWLKETNAAIEAEAAGRPDDAAGHQSEANRLVNAVGAMGFDIRDLVEYVG